MLKILSIILFCLHLTQTYSRSQDYIAFAGDKAGNVTSEELNYINRFISEAENMYSPPYELNSIAKYIYTKMNTIYKIDFWSTYVLGNQTNRIGFQGEPDLDKYLWRTKYGKYNLTYVMWRTGTCWKEGEGGMIVPFGQSLTANQRDKITQIVNNSISYRGDNIQGAAQYINDKTTSLGFGGWTSIIWWPVSEFGFHQCRLREYWANFKQYGDLKFNYYLSRP